MVTSFTTRKGITLPEGLYDCSYEAAITYQTADSTIHTSLSGYARSLELMGAQGSVSIGSYQVENKDDFIIEEIFFTGTLQSSGKQYYGDGYVKIYNNTDHMLYADGVALMESKFVTAQKIRLYPRYYEHSHDCTGCVCNPR